MRFLPGANMSKAAYRFLVDAGHEVEWVRNWSSDPGDETILNHAREQRMVVVTFDKDFGNSRFAAASRTPESFASTISMQRLKADWPCSPHVSMRKYSLMAGW